MFQTLKWQGAARGELLLLDQRRLPHSEEYIRCRDVAALRDAIAALAVRGAPAIGVAAAFGFVLALRDMDDDSPATRARRAIDEAADLLAASRPTAVNLFHAIDRMKNRANEFDGSTVGELKKALLEEARAIRDEDIAMCKLIGEHGQSLIKDGHAILTHCNAGALATAGQGTALAPMFEARRLGRKFSVYVDETRPLLQGARLTAWELRQADIETTLICDSMAGFLMKQEKISAVFTGADRIAANGDVANKIGTYSLAVLARAHGVPFYVFAPSSTFDLAIPDGDAIPIEQRDPAEVSSCADIPIAPAGINVYNPAFDVTPAANITAIVTEKGLIQNPCPRSVADHFAKTLP